MRAIVKQAQKVGCFLQTHDLLQEFSGIGADHIALMFKNPYSQEGICIIMDE